MSTLSSTTIIELDKLIRKAMQDGTAVASNIGHAEGRDFTVAITDNLAKELDLERTCNGVLRRAN